MKYYLLFILLLIPCIYSVTSESETLKVDFVVKPAIDTHIGYFVINPIANPETKGYQYIKINLVGVPGVGGIIDKKQYYFNDHYVIYIESKDSKYHTFEPITFNVTVANLFRYSDKNATLNTYIASPSYDYLFNESYHYESIEPACRNGQFNITTKLCNYGNTSFPAKLYSTQVNYTLPWYYPLGQWSFNVRFYSNQQGPILVKNIFNYTLWWLVIVVCIVYYLYRRHRKQQIALASQSRARDETEEIKKKMLYYDDEEDNHKI
jgi:cbb3-type cytochrome oxidase subunit 3